MLNIISISTMVVILSVLAACFIFLAFFTKSWGFNMWTWLFALPGSLRAGASLVVILIASALCLGFFLGYVG